MKHWSSIGETMFFFVFLCFSDRQSSEPLGDQVCSLSFLQARFCNLPFFLALHHYMVHLSRLQFSRISTQGANTTVTYLFHLFHLFHPSFMLCEDV